MVVGIFMGGAEEAALSIAESSSKLSSLSFPSRDLSTEKENLTVSASTPVYCCLSPEASETAPLKRNAFSFSGFVTDKASEALSTTCAQGILKARSSEREAQ